MEVTGHQIAALLLKYGDAYNESARERDDAEDEDGVGGVC